jgi:hypothetical protein
VAGVPAGAGVSGGKRAVLVGLDKEVARRVDLGDAKPRVIIWRRRIFCGPYYGQWPGEDLPYFEFEPLILRDE